jgi:hypothetical protein
MLRVSDTEKLYRFRNIPKGEPVVSMPDLHRENGAPALMKLITTLPLPHSDILATDAQLSKARQNHYDPPAEHSGFGGPSSFGP